MRARTWLALFLVASCGGGEGGNPAGAERAIAREPAIVLVTIDTLRRDHLGCYGYFRDTSPNLDALAREGVLFERAMATMATTLPSHLSMLTGLYPHQHGMLANLMAVRSPFQTEEGRRSAAELLREAGFATAAFVSGRPVGSRTGIAAGFETFDEPEGDWRPGGETAERARAWLEAHAGGRFFLWVHLWDPHEPNQPPEPFASAFTADERIDRLLEERRVDPVRLQATASDYVRARLFQPALAENVRKAARVGTQIELAPIDLAALRDLYDRYDGDVLYADHCIGRVFDALKGHGAWDRAIVAVTADHGQSLGQHDWLDHGILTGENLFVPLIVRFPEGMVPQPARIGRPVSVVDLMPTLLARLGGEPVRRLAEQAEGEDALAPGSGRGYAFAQRAVRGGAKDWDDEHRYALVQGRWKYVHSTAGGGELFDLDADSGELDDVAAEHPAVVARMRALALEIAGRGRAAKGDGPEGATDPELLESLKRLGYAGEE